MTREEAIRELKADYCGNRIICELYPDQCNQEDCEIWLAITALAEQPIGVLETQPDGDTISRQAAIDKLETIGYDFSNSGLSEIELEEVCEAVGDVRQDMIRMLKNLPSAQPEITPDGTLNVSIDADIANVGRILLSQAGTQYGGLYYKDEQPEIIMCKDCKHYRKERGWNCIEYMVCAISSIHTVIRKPDDFCSRGVRRTDGTE